MTVSIVRGNALDLPLADNSVDLVVTSPPYFGLRSYQDGGEHYTGQLGSEPTPAEFVDALIAATREMMRVVKPCGSIWVNLGDKYSTGNGGESGLTELGQRLGTGGGQKSDAAKQRSGRVQGMKPKSLIGIPWRYALRCIDDLGLILRAEVIWSKPNGLPESVTDRVRRSHEQWFHFVQRPRYFSAVDEVREATSDYRGAAPRPLAERTTTLKVPGNVPMSGTALESHPLGKLPSSVWEDHSPRTDSDSTTFTGWAHASGTVWSIPTQPLTVPAHLGVDHFAAFPMEWPRRIIRGWSPSGVCVECGDGRRPVTTKTASHREGGYRPENDPLLRRPGRTAADISGSTLGMVSEFTITGRACACGTEGEQSWSASTNGTSIDASPLSSCGVDGAGRSRPLPPTRPAVVLDPFGGTGTTALVAHALGRHGISVDMSADYCRLAEWRTSDRGQLAAAMQVEKPKTEIEGQDDLFGEWSA